MAAHKKEPVAYMLPTMSIQPEQIAKFQHMLWEPRRGDMTTGQVWLNALRSLCVPVYEDDEGITDAAAIIINDLRQQLTQTRLFMGSALVIHEAYRIQPSEMVGQIVVDRGNKSVNIMDKCTEGCGKAADCGNDYCARVSMDAAETLPDGSIRMLPRFMRWLPEDSTLQQAQQFAAALGIDLLWRNYGQSEGIASAEELTAWVRDREKTAQALPEGMKCIGMMLSPCGNVSAYYAKPRAGGGA